MLDETKRASAADVPTIEIREGICAECGAGMIAANGLCLGCSAKAVRGERMKSEIGSQVRARFKEGSAMLDKTKQTSAPAKDEETAHRFAKDQLKAFVERVERLEEEKKALTDDIRDIYAEAKCNGFDAKALRTVVRMRKQDINERKEQEAILETYLHALGMI